MVNVHRLIYVHSDAIFSISIHRNPNSYIYATAWASALLILGRWQYQSQVCGMSDEFRFPRFLFSSFYVCAGLGIFGEKEKDRHFIT